jgi:hypothetical protein
MSPVQYMPIQNNYKGGKIMQKRVYIIICLITFLFVGTFSTACYAERRHKGKIHGLENKVFHKFDLAMANQVELGLTDEQYEKIKMLEISTTRDLIKKKAEIDVLKIDIKVKFWEDKIDIEGINKLIDKKYEFKKAKAKTLVNAYAQFIKILAEEQKKILRDMIRKRHKR